MGELVELTARVFLASVLVVAGFSKLADRAGARRAIVEFGVPRRFATPLVVLLPVVELAIAAALLAGWAPLWGAVAAAASTVVALFVGGSAALVQLLRSIRRLLSRNRWLRVPLDALDVRLERAAYRFWVSRARARWPEGLPLGSRAPRFHFPTLDGSMLTLNSLLGRKQPVMLLFVADPVSAVWSELLAEVTATAGQSGVTIAIVSRKPERDATRSNGRPAGEVLFQDHWEMLQAYRVYEIPSAVVVRPDGTIGSSVATGVDEISELAAETAHT